MGGRLSNQDVNPMRLAHIFLGLIHDLVRQSHQSKQGR